MGFGLYVQPRRQFSWSCSVPFPGLRFLFTPLLIISCTFFFSFSCFLLPTVSSSLPKESQFSLFRKFFLLSSFYVLIREFVSDLISKGSDILNEISICSTKNVVRGG